MKNNINEIKRLQRLAGIITEANIVKEESPNIGPGGVAVDDDDWYAKGQEANKSIVTDPTKKKTFQIQNIEKDLADRTSDFKSIDTKNEISALVDMVIDKITEFHPEVQNTGVLKQALYKIYQDYSKIKSQD